MVTAASETFKNSPLNMMIMTEGCENQFALMKEQLELCVGTNQYTIYPLSSANYASPWQSSCRAVFIPPNAHTSSWNVLDDYVKDGGCIVSFNSQWNRLNGFPYPTGLTANSLVRIHLCLNASNDPFHAMTIPDDANDEQGGDIVTARNGDVLAEAVLDEQSKVAVVIGKETLMMMSYIDMMSPHINYNDTDMLAALKSDVLPRRHALRRLLSKADIKCSEAAPPCLSLCYLLATDKVSHERYIPIWIIAVYHNNQVSQCL